MRMFARARRAFEEQREIVGAVFDGAFVELRDEADGCAGETTERAERGIVEELASDRAADAAEKAPFDGPVHRLQDRHDHADHGGEVLERGAGAAARTSRRSRAFIATI